MTRLSEDYAQEVADMQRDSPTLQAVDPIADAAELETEVDVHGDVRWELGITLSGTDCTPHLAEAAMTERLVSMALAAVRAKDMAQYAHFVANEFLWLTCEINGKRNAAIDSQRKKVST